MAISFFGIAKSRVSQDYRCDRPDPEMLPPRRQGRNFILGVLGVLAAKSIVYEI
jgi:hypothetical protein